MKRSRECKQSDPITNIIAMQLEKSLKNTSIRTKSFDGSSKTLIRAELPDNAARRNLILVAPLEAKVREGAAALQEKVSQWRRDIHQHPELGDQETRTSRLVADHLRNLGLEVRAGVGGTGVVGLSQGPKILQPSFDLLCPHT